MNAIKAASISLIFLLSLVGGKVHASIYLYEFNGDLTGDLLAGSRGEPIANLLNVSRNLPINVPFNLKFMVDTTSIPYVENDTSALQELIYRNAILNAELNLNGTTFKTLRTPISRPGSLSSFDESRIDIINRIPPAVDSDLFGIRLTPAFTPSGASDLFNNYTVPFNQTIDGTFIDNVNVSLNKIMFVTSGIDLFDGSGLPTDNHTFDPLPIVSGMQIQLDSDLGSFGLINTFARNNITLDITPVPIPAAVWFFVSSLGLVGLLKRQSNQAISA